MPTFYRKPEIVSFYSYFKQPYTISTIMITRSSEMIFKIWNIRLLEEVNAYIYRRSLAFIVLSNNRTQNCATDRQTYYWNNLPGTCN